jgi:hypothetical protein
MDTGVEVELHINVIMSVVVQLIKKEDDIGSRLSAATIRSRLLILDPGISELFNKARCKHPQCCNSSIIGCKHSTILLAMLLKFATMILNIQSVF